MILAGDVGGTKARLALYEMEGGALIRRDTETFLSQDYTGLGQVIESFVRKRTTPVTRACFGVPGAVIDGSAEAANLPWKMSEAEIATALGITRVKLVNDLVATTAAVPFIRDDDLLVLHQGNKPSSPSTCGVLAPGTGLGQAFLFYETGHYHVLPSEGGHADFAPVTDLEIELLKYLSTKFEHVSYERVLSGPGLVNIYNFLKDTGHAQEPAELCQQVQGEDAAAVISSSAQAGEHEICMKALDLFVSVLGAQAGNLALTLVTTGGIYLGGGIPPKICEKLADGTLLSAFLSKGRLSDFVEKVPLYVIRDDHAALLGAASLAAEL